jgi:hypothetical protein
VTKAKNTAEAAFLALVFSGKNSILTAKDTKIYDNDFSELRVSLENACAGTIWATYWHEASVLPAKAGIHPPSVAWMPAFAGMTNQESNPVVLVGLQFQIL